MKRPCLFIVGHTTVAVHALPGLPGHAAPVSKTPAPARKARRNLEMNTQQQALLNAYMAIP